MAGDGTRVVLQPPVAGTDYVNASWVPGYSGDRAFVISQHPNNFSLEQFWHMVWQTDTQTIICLSAFQQPVSWTSGVLLFCNDLLHICSCGNCNGVDGKFRSLLLFYFVHVYCLSCCYSLYR